jgi:iron complex transport system substrate-binding protein
MNKWLWLFLFILCWTATGLAIFGFQQEQNHNTPTLPAQADRIVSMAPNLTEILFALGLDDKIVSVTLDSDYPPATIKIPKVGTFWQPNIEAVIAAKPNLVITLGFTQQKNLAQRLKRIGYNSLTLNIDKVSEFFGAIRIIGTATNKQSEANELVGDITDKLDKLSKLVGTNDKVRVLWVVQREPLRVAGRDTFINEMIELAGGENAIGPTLHKYPPIGAEQVIACNPEVIIEPAMNTKYLTKQQSDALEYWRRFKNISAVTNKRIYIIDGNIVSRLGPRLYQGIETIAECLRPELFAY